MDRSISFSLCSMSTCSCCQRVCLLPEAGGTLWSRIVGTEAFIVDAIHVGEVLTATVLRSSLVRSCTSLCSLMFFCYRQSYN